MPSTFVAYGSIAHLQGLRLLILVLRGAYKKSQRDHAGQPREVRINPCSSRRFQLPSEAFLED